FDLVGYAVGYACGDRYPIPRPRQPKAMGLIILGVQRYGRLVWNERELQSLRREGWVHELILDLPWGAPVEPFINGRHRVGEALIGAVDRNEVEARLAEFRQRLALAAI